MDTKGVTPVSPVPSDHVFNISIETRKSLVTTTTHNQMPYNQSREKVVMSTN